MIYESKTTQTAKTAVNTLLTYCYMTCMEKKKQNDKDIKNKTHSLYIYIYKLFFYCIIVLYFLSSVKHFYTVPRRTPCDCLGRLHRRRLMCVSVGFYHLKLRGRLYNNIILFTVG